MMLALLNPKPALGLLLDDCSSDLLLTLRLPSIFSFRRLGALTDGNYRKTTYVIDFEAIHRGS
jgi:hypothetical protein